MKFVGAITQHECHGAEYWEMQDKRGFKRPLGPDIGEVRGEDVHDQKTNVFVFRALHGSSLPTCRHLDWRGDCTFSVNNKMIKDKVHKLLDRYNNKELHYSREFLEILRAEPRYESSCELTTVPQDIRGIIRNKTHCIFASGPISWPDKAYDTTTPATERQI